MPIDFRLEERLAGFALAPAGPGQDVPVQYRELLGPSDGAKLTDRLEQLQSVLFGKIPGLPSPSLIDHLLIVIHSDLSGTAHVNELEVKAQVKVGRDLEAGSPVFVSDIVDVSSIDLGVDVPNDSAVVVVRSLGWKRALFFDFGPLAPNVGPRDYELDRALAQQALMLLGLPSPPTGPLRIDQMEEGLRSLEALLGEGNQREMVYQELLEEHPWMLGGQYSAMERHQKLDDANVPDFTAVRCYDDFRDILELKQPLLPLFRQDGGFAVGFNDAWTQAERYLGFADRQRIYLLEEKQLRFDNPRALIIAGVNLTEVQLAEIRNKERFAQRILFLSYDQLLGIARNVLRLMRIAQAPIEPGVG